MIWLSRRIVEALHEVQLAEHGGGTGLRDAGLLESALARPLNREGYGDPDIAELASMYAMGIARNHPFIDGNKRAAFMALVLFLALNGIAFEVPEAGAVMTMLSMAAGETGEETFIAWVRTGIRPRG